MTKTRWLLIWYVVQDNKVNVQSNVGAFHNGINYCDPKLLSLEHHLGCNCQHTTCDSIQTFYCLTYSVSRHSKYIRVKREKNGKKQDVPCSFICLICFTVSFRIAHLSGLTLKLSMSLKLAKMSSASSSMYLFSCSRLRFSLLRLGLKKEKILDWVWMSWKTIEMHTWTSITATK